MTNPPPPDVRTFVRRHPWVCVAAALLTVSTFSSLDRRPRGGPGSGTATPQTSHPADLLKPQRVAPGLAASFVNPSLKDPQSAQYRDVTYHVRKGFPVFCGEVNAHNGFGGYGGFTGFIAIANVVEFASGTPDRQWRRNWTQWCVQTDHDDRPAASQRGARGHGA